MAQSRHKANTQIELLVEKAIRGDAGALSELCEIMAESILLQVAFILSDFAEAEDVAQNVLVCVCRNIHRLKSPKAFKVWLSRIIINKKNDYLREKKKRDTLINTDDFFENIPDDNPSFFPQECVEAGELRSALTETIFQLPTRQCKSTILHYYCDMSVTEIAQVMGVTSQSISKHLAIARGKLKCKLQGLAAY